VNRVVGWVTLAMMMFFTGIGIGLLIAWGIMPVRSVDTAPGTLQQADKDRYRALIAEEYLASGDDERAKARMELLDDKNALSALSNQIDRATWTNDAEGIALVKLYSDLIVTTMNQAGTSAKQITPIPSTGVFTESTAMLEMSQAVTSALTETVTETNSVIPARLVLLNRTPSCRSDRMPPVLEITVVDRSGKPIGGVVIVVSSAGITERIITGLKPGSSAGVADFLMQAGMKYIISLEGRAGSSEYLTTSICTYPDGELYAGGWSVQIQY
jgi:hypothetical protein